MKKALLAALLSAYAVGACQKVDVPVSKIEFSPPLGWGPAEAQVPDGAQSLGSWRHPESSMQLQLERLRVSEATIEDTAAKGIEHAASRGMRVVHEMTNDQVAFLDFALTKDGSDLVRHVVILRKLKTDILRIRGTWLIEDDAQDAACMLVVVDFIKTVRIDGKEIKRRL